MHSVIYDDCISENVVALNVPSLEDLAELQRQIDELREALQRLQQPDQTFLQTLL